MLEPDELPRFVIQGQTGLNPAFRWITFWLVVANKARIIVVTDRRIAVLSAGQLRMRRNTPPAQVGLAWLLGHAANVLLIPGTSSLSHLSENVVAGGVHLDTETMIVLDGLAGTVA